MDTGLKFAIAITCKWKIEIGFSVHFVAKLGTPKRNKGRIPIGRYITKGMTVMGVVYQVKSEFVETSFYILKRMVGQMRGIAHPPGVTC